MWRDTGNLPMANAGRTVFARELHMTTCGVCSIAAALCAHARHMIVANQVPKMCAALETICARHEA